MEYSFAGCFLSESVLFVACSIVIAGSSVFVYVCLVALRACSVPVSFFYNDDCLDSAILLVWFRVAEADIELCFPRPEKIHCVVFTPLSAPLAQRAGNTMAFYYIVRKPSGIRPARRFPLGLLGIKKKNTLLSQKKRLQTR